MRTTEERIKAMHQRAAEIDKEKNRRQIRLIGSAAVLMCLVLVVFLGLMMPGISEKIMGDTVSDGMAASIFSRNGALGYIVIAVLAFLLGTAVTVFCVKLKSLRETEEDRK